MKIGTARMSFSYATPADGLEAERVREMLRFVLPVTFADEVGSGRASQNY
jgi:hypothetical protein